MTTLDLEGIELMTTSPLSLSVYVLEDEKHEQERIEEALRGVESLLANDYFAQAHIGRAAISPVLQPFFFRSVEGFRAQLEDPADDTSGPALLVIDVRVYLTEQDEEPQPLLGEENVYSGENRPRTSFWDWLRRTAPAVPGIVLTTMEENALRDLLASFDQDRLHYVHKDRLANPTLFSRDIVGFLEDKHWAMPFWRNLSKYARVSGSDSWHTPGHNAGTSFLNSSFLRGFADEYAPGSSLALAGDLSVSVDKLGDLSEPFAEDSPMARAMVLSARTFGAAETLYATNGTSTSNKVMLMTLLRPDEVVIVDRNCHKSVHQAVVLAGAIPLYLESGFNSSLGTFLPVTLGDIENVTGNKELTAAFEPRMLILTTCTYEGVLFPIQEIAEACREAKPGILFYADEAWFPYGYFHPFYGPGTSPWNQSRFASHGGGSTGRYNALGTDEADGAHFVVQSTHKALSALSQASMIHTGKAFHRVHRYAIEQLATGSSADQRYSWLAERFPSETDFRDQLADVSRFWLTTSPNYPMIATLDCASTQMAAEGFGIVNRLLHFAAELDDLARELDADVTLRDLTGGQPGYEKFKRDPLKFLVAVKPGRLKEFKKLLAERRIACEKSAAAVRLFGEGSESGSAGGHVQFLITVGTSLGQVQNLKLALRRSRELGYLGWSNRGAVQLEPGLSGQVEVVPRDAHYACGEIAFLSEICDNPGRPFISCQMLVPYPPGIPTVLPGMRIQPKEAARLRKILGDPTKDPECEVHGVLKRPSPSGPEYAVRVLTEAELDIFRQRYKATGLDKKLARLRSWACV